MTSIYAKIMSSQKAFLIAEAGVNHNGSLARAKKMVDVAKKAGCDAIKFQTFTAEAVISKYAAKAEYQKKQTGKDESQYEMVKKLELSEKEHLDLVRYCRKNKMLFLSTPFDEGSVDLLEKLKVPIYKIPSGEITNVDLMQKVARTHKPIILSTGMASIKEIQEACKILNKAGCEEIILLQCVTAYPTPLKDANVTAMYAIESACGCPVGFSDHTLGIAASLAAASLGASVIEKHFTLDKNLKGPDHKASLSIEELNQWVKGIRDIELALGDGKKDLVAVEKSNMKVSRKSCVAVRDIANGEKIAMEDIVIKRPGTGVSPKEKKIIIGKRIKQSIKKDQVFKKTMF